MLIKGQIRLTGGKGGEVFLITVKHITPTGCPIMCFWLPQLYLRNPNEIQRWILCSFFVWNIHSNKVFISLYIYIVIILYIYYIYIYIFYIYIYIFSCWFLHDLHSTSVTLSLTKHLNFICSPEELKYWNGMMQSLNNKLFAKYEVQSFPIYSTDKKWEETTKISPKTEPETFVKLHLFDLVSDRLVSERTLESRRGRAIRAHRHVYARIGNTDEVRQKEDRDRETAGWMAGSVSNYRLLITPPDPSVRRFTQEQSPTPTSRKVEDPHLGSQWLD